MSGQPWSWEKFLANARPDANGCWPWWLAKVKGYGVATHRNKRYTAHRLAWMIFNGPIPIRYVIHHTCGHRDCVNPMHLECLEFIIHYRLHDKGPHKAYCGNGHPYSKENTYTSPKGGRFCRTCGGEATRRYLSRRGSHA